MIDFSSRKFHPVVHLPEEVEIRDFTKPAHMQQPPKLPFSIGRYNEDRVGMYVHDLFEGQRTVHMGIDIGAPLHTPVFAFWDGIVFAAGYNPAPGDYGHVIVTEHSFEGTPLWALYGHLSAASVEEKQPGEPIQKGAQLGTLGAASENGGWPVHLHFQLSLKRPVTHDLPGVVSPEERAAALLKYPDPRLILGAVY